MASQPIEANNEAVTTMADVFDAPDYDGLPRLGNGCTKSLFANNGHFILDEMATINILKPIQDGTSPNSWSDLVAVQSCNNESLWFCVMTMTEYNAMVDEDTGILTSLDGSFRQSRGWSQLILHGTTMDAVCNLAYHASMGHTVLDNVDKGFVIVGLTMDMYNWSSHNSYKPVNHFQRGHSVQYSQVIAGDRYNLSQFEKTKVLLCNVTQYDVTMLFDRYTYDKGFVWVYGAPINAMRALATSEDNPCSLSTGNEPCWFTRIGAANNGIPARLQEDHKLCRREHNQRNQRQAQSRPPWPSTMGNQQETLRQQEENEEGNRTGTKGREQSCYKAHKRRQCIATMMQCLMCTRWKHCNGPMKHTSPTILHHELTARSQCRCKATFFVMTELCRSTMQITSECTLVIEQWMKQNMLIQQQCEWTNV